jgi:hypothetical protein
MRECTSIAFERYDEYYWTVNHVRHVSYTRSRFTFYKTWATDLLEVTGTNGSLFGRKSSIVSVIPIAFVFLTIFATPISANALTNTYWVGLNGGTGWLTGQAFSQGVLVTQTIPPQDVPNVQITVSEMVRVYSGGQCWYNFYYAYPTTDSSGSIGTVWLGPWWVSGLSEIDNIFYGNSNYGYSLGFAYIGSYC